MVHVKTFDLFQPTMGDGHCWVAYELTADDFDRIVHKGKLLLRKDMGLPNDEMDMEKKFRETWPNYEGGLESYVLGANSDSGPLGTAEIVASSDHTRAVFFMSDL